MTDDEKRSFLQCLFSAAWVDGSIGETEHAILATLYNNVELPADVRDEIDGWFDSAPPEPDWFQAASNTELRDTLVKQVFLIAASDGNVDTAELGLLERLKVKLGLSDRELGALTAEVEKILAGQN